jgi:hypothetical protein
MADFASLKKNRQTVFANLSNEFSKLNTTTTSSEDDRFWKPEVDKAGNGYAIIRFLPAPDGEDVPFVRVWDHGFQGTGGWYIEKSLTTIGQKDPVSEHNTQLWNSGIESNKEQVRKQKRRLSYYSNIYVVKDPSHPENEGKVFLFKYGKKIFEKLNAAMNPEFEDEQPMNPFDLWEGANFKLKIRNVEGYRNYDKSEFEAAAPLVEDDEELEKIWRREHSLNEFIDPKNFKSYDELKDKLNRVLGLSGGSPKATTTAANSSYDEEEHERPAAPIKSIKPKSTVTTADDDEDDIDFFKKLAEE